MKFLVVATQRSGTIMLTAFLNSHPELKCYAEEGPDFLNELKEKEGSNLKYNQILSSTPLKDFKILHLVRKDLFALSMSKVINKHKKKYGRPDHIFKSSKAEDLEFPMSDKLPKKASFLKELSSYAKSANKEKKPIIINPWELRWKMLLSSTQILKWSKKLKDFNTLTVFYEDITNGGEVNKMPQNIADQICDFLEVEKRPLTTSMGKVNPKNYEEYIINWNKIRQTGEKIIKCHNKKLKEVIA